MEPSASSRLQRSNDFLQPFVIDHSRIRGQLVRLGPVVNEILTRHAYPDTVSRALAELLVIGAMLSVNLKADGVVTLQAKGDGPVKFLVVDATSRGGLRGYAELAAGGAKALVALEKKRKKSKNAEAVTLRDVLGAGYLAITLDMGADARYQGVVALADTSLADAIRGYFTQSQQVEMDIRLSVGHAVQDGAHAWSAGGIMMERMPGEGGARAPDEADPDEEEEEDPEEQWRRCCLFMETVTAAELLEEGVSSWSLLERLFNEEGVWAYPPRHLSAQCRCSRERIEQALRTIAREELESMMVDGEMTVNCQFCNKGEGFSRAEIAAWHGAV